MTFFIPALIMEPTPQAHEELHRLLNHGEVETDIQIAELSAAHALIEPAGWLMHVLQRMPDGTAPSQQQHIWNELLCSTIIHLYAALRKAEDGDDLPIPYAPVLWVMLKEDAISSVVDDQGDITFSVEGDPLVTIRQPIINQVTDPFNDSQVTVGVKLTASKVGETSPAA
jgi:hypothetical protein